VSGQLTWINPAFDIRDLSGSKSNYFSMRIVAIKGVKIVEISTGSAANNYLTRFHKHSGFMYVVMGINLPEALKKIIDNYQVCE
jgi:hypothetical protein